MRGLLKFTLLAFSFCLNLSAIDFANIHISFYDGRSSFPLNSSYKKVNDVEFLSNSYLRIGDYVYSYSGSSENLFNLFLKKGDGFYSDAGMSKLHYYDSSHEKYTVYCESNTARGCSFEASTSYPSPVEFSYFKTYDISYFITCPSDQHFNTDTKKCQKCPDGQSWNPATNSCFNDCTDPNKNKYGFTDGSCTDCSAAKTTGDIYRCFCGSLGLGVPGAVNDIGVIGKPGYFKGECSNGFVFEYKDPEFKPDPKPDDNKTKPDDPNPNPDDNNKTKPDDPNNPNQGGNQGGNNGGNQGDNTNPDSKDGDLCKKNPKDPKCKPETKPGDGNTTIVNNNGGGNNANGDNLKFTPDGSAGKYEKDINDFAGKFKEAAGGIVGEFGNFKKGVDQLIANIEGKGIKDVKSQAIPSSCPREFTVDMFGNSYVIKIDYCKYIAPTANVLYYIFYILFFLAFLLGVYKTVLFLI